MKKLLVILIAFVFVGMLSESASAQRTWWSVIGRRVVALDSARVQGIATFNSRVVGGSANFATIDSFLTTAAVDTITMTGAAVGDVFSVTEYTPAWSATPDTGAGNYRAWVISANTVVVGRTKLNAASTLKSAGAYFIVKYEK